MQKSKMQREHEHGIESDIEAPIEHQIDTFSNQYRRTRALLDSIVGGSRRKKDMGINIIFLSIIILLFVIEIATELLPPLLSLEIGILLVSIKIIWMINIQSRYQHFHFWVLNAIEQKLNGLDERLRNLEKMQRKERTRKE